MHALQMEQYNCGVAERRLLRSWVFKATSAFCLARVEQEGVSRRFLLGIVHWKRVEALLNAPSGGVWALGYVSA
jgi:hypothetical protein